MGERLDLCLQHIARVKKQFAQAQEQVRAAQEVQQQMEEKLTNGLRDLEILRAEASKHPAALPGPSGHDRLWPVRFWPSCFAGQFWPVRFWPKLVFSVVAILASLFQANPFLAKIEVLDVLN